MNILLAQFCEQEPHFFKDGDKVKAFEEIKPFINDICYNSLIILRASDEEEPNAKFTNQAAEGVRKLGIQRIRAIENLKWLLAAISKVHGLKSGLISEALRRKIIETMLYLIRTYHFCSISHQQGLVILNYLKELFDDEDLRMLKSFVKECFEGDTKFHFPSGKIASGMTMGQVTKIAFELRNITQQALDNMDSSENEDEDVEAYQKRVEIDRWQKFCKEKIDKLYKIWETKLGSNEKHSSSNKSENSDPDMD